MTLHVYEWQYVIGKSRLFFALSYTNARDLRVASSLEPKWQLWLTVAANFVYGGIVADPQFAILGWHFKLCSSLKQCFSVVSIAFDFLHGCRSRRRRRSLLFVQVRSPFWRSTALGFGWGARASLRIVLFCGLEPGWRWSAIVELLEVLVDCLIYEEFLAINLGNVVCDVGQSTNPHAETPFPPHSLDPTSNSLNQSKVLIKCVVKVNWPTHDWIAKH